MRKGIIPTELEDIQRVPENVKLPEGVVATADGMTLSNKALALELFDNDCPIFVVGEDGNSYLLENRDDVINHSGMYNVAAEELYLFLQREYHEPQKEKTMEQTIAEQRDMALAEISALTGVSLTQLQALPIDIKDDIVTTYQQNINTLSNDEVKKQLSSILESKPLFSAEREREEKYNPLAKVEELVEGNYNQIDGIINNLPPPKHEGSEKQYTSLSEIKALANSIKGGEHDNAPSLPFSTVDDAQRQRG